MTEVEREVQLVLPSPKKLFTPAVTAIIALLIIGYTLANYATDFTIKHLAISATGIFHGKIWQLITYSFINPGGCSLVFNGLVVLFFGSSIEREWRTTSYLKLWLIVSITCGVIWVTINLITGKNYVGLGTAACSYGLIGSFGLLFRRKRFWFFLWTVEAQHIAIFMIAVGIILGIPTPIMWIWVTGAAVAFLYVKLRLRMGSSRSRQARQTMQSRKRGFVDID